jgi:hypothetical protein
VDAFGLSSSTVAYMCSQPGPMEPHPYRMRGDVLPVGVRCIFRHADLRAYEERVTTWHAGDFREAIAAAEAEAETYASGLDDVEFTGFTQAFQMFGAPGVGAEVFSLMRESDLDRDSYLSAFFDTGRERQQSRSR